MIFNPAIAGSGGPWKEVEAQALWTEVISTAAPAGRSRKLVKSDPSGSSRVK